MSQFFLKITKKFLPVVHFLQEITIYYCESLPRAEIFVHPLKFLKSLNNWRKYFHSLLTRPQWKIQVKNHAITVSHSKTLYQFVVFIEPYPSEKKSAL